MFFSLMPGNYVGMLAAAMFFGRFLASYIWGLIADHKGRKPVIIASSILLGLSSAVFGFSTHFAMAIMVRFVVGATNGKNVLYLCCVFA